MEIVRGPGLAETQKAEVWHRWKAGQSLSDISRALEKRACTVHRVLAIRGGIAPVARTRSPHALTLVEREDISRGLVIGRSFRRIAADLGRPTSTISREVNRHGGRDAYRATQADQQAWAQAERPKPYRLAIHPRLRKIVARKLALEWSPEQIAGWLKLQFPGSEAMQVSHETIYRSLFIQAWRVEEGVGSAPALTARDAQVQVGEHGRPAARTNCGCHFHQ